MLSLEEISDRLEIQELLARYVYAIDSQQWDLLDDVFTDDAFIDYSAFGGAVGSLPEIKAFLAAVLPGFPAYQHLVANTLLELDGDTATGRTMCNNPMVMPNADDTKSMLVCGLWYVDEFRRTDAGWRISRRVEEKSYAWTHPPTPKG